VSTNHPRISPFWLDPTRTLPEPTRYCYGLEDGRVYRFADPDERAAWIDAREGRERVAARDQRVKRAIEAGEWEGEE
jgi:hypothetical protein